MPGHGHGANDALTLGDRIREHGLRGGAQRDDGAEPLAVGLRQEHGACVGVQQSLRPLSDELEDDR